MGNDWDKYQFHVLEFIKNQGKINDRVIKLEIKFYGLLASGMVGIGAVIYKLFSIGG